MRLGYLGGSTETENLMELPSTPDEELKLTENSEQVLLNDSQAACDDKLDNNDCNVDCFPLNKDFAANSEVSMSLFVLATQ